MFLLSSDEYPWVELLDHIIVLFLIFLRSLYTIFHSGYTNVHSHQWSFFSPHFPQHLLFVVLYFIITIPTHFIVALICNSLMINDVEHLFRCLLAIYMFSLEKCLFRPSAHFLIKFFFLTLSYRHSLDILDINPSSDILFANVFSHAVSGLFISCIVSLNVQKLFNFM